MSLFQQNELLKSKLLEKVKMKNQNQQQKPLNILTINFICFEKMQPMVRKILEHHFADIVQLKINNCDLRTMEGFPDLPFLTDLNISKNSLQGTFQFIVKNRSLKYIDASDNIIKDLRKLEPLKKLKKVNLCIKNNPIVNIYSSLTGKESLSSKLKIMGVTLLQKPKQIPQQKKTSPQKGKPKKAVPKDKKKEAIHNLFTIKSSDADERGANWKNIREIYRLQKQINNSNENSEENRISRRLPITMSRYSSIQEIIQDIRRRDRIPDQANARDEVRQQRNQSRETHARLLERIKSFYEKRNTIASRPRKKHHWAQNENQDQRIEFVEQRNPDNIFRTISVPQLQQNQSAQSIRSNSNNNNNQNENNSGNQRQRSGIFWAKLEEDEGQEQLSVEEDLSQDLEEDEEGQGQQINDDYLNDSSISPLEEVQFNIDNDFIEFNAFLENDGNQRENQNQRRSIRNIFERPAFHLQFGNLSSNSDHQENK